MRIGAWIRSAGGRLFRPLRTNDELRAELLAHIEHRADDLERAGMSRAAAERQARVEFGGVEKFRQQSQEAMGGNFVESMLRDVRFSVRSLRKSPGFALTAVVTLALGIGANAAIFTLVHGILLRTLPVANPAQLYRIGDNDDCCMLGGFPGRAHTTGDFSIFSYDLYQYLKNAAPEFEQLAAVQAGQGRWSARRANGKAWPVYGEFVTGNYFSMLSLHAFAGRLFSASDDTPSAPPTAVLSYQAWQGEYASDPSIVGSTIYIQAKPFTVVGIAPPGFFGDRVTNNPPDFWMPLHTEPYIQGTTSMLHHSDFHWLYLLGRIRPETNIGALQARLSGALRQWLYSRPNMTANGSAARIPKMHVVLTPAGGGIQNLQQKTGTGLKLLMILSSVVLLIACANIANLMLARATTRRADIAVRMALGAGRHRVIRQILTESVLLSFMGGLAGLALAYMGCQTILVLAFPHATNLPIHASPDLAVLGFAFLVALVTGILFGTGPAWLSFHAQPMEALHGIHRTTHDRSSLPQKALVVLQAALSVVLIAGAILMTKSLVNLEHQNLGVATAHRYVVHFDPAGAGYAVSRLPGLYREIEHRFSALPGMAHVGLTMYSPLEGDTWGECVIQRGHSAPHHGDNCYSAADRVSTEFLDSIGVPIVEGRGFTEQDTATSPQVALVNEAFVKRFFPKTDPIGQHFGLDFPRNSGAFEIVGVFRDFKIDTPRSRVQPVFLRPLTQQFLGYTNPTMITVEAQSMYMGAMVLDFRKLPPNVDSLVRRTLAGVDPTLAVMGLQSFRAQVTGSFSQERLIARLTGLFGILAVILASVGLYGVMSYFVARRTGEIGVRMALGATRPSVVAMVMRGALWQVLIGLALGIPAALVAGHLMASQLYGVRGSNPLALIGATLVLGVCAAVAGYVPARRAASIDPMEALHME